MLLRTVKESRAGFDPKEMKVLTVFQIWLRPSHTSLPVSPSSKIALVLSWAQINTLGRSVPLCFLYPGHSFDAAFDCTIEIDS